ncbi:MAG: hypothetical protein HY736_28050 [Verrucomicrobia bacterium]|nr:hypothetical protein [Verrucomicrobiota bacterium]
MTTRGTASLFPRRHGWRWLPVVVVGIGVTACWLLSHLLPQHDYFVKRRGAIAAVETGPEVRQSRDYVSQSVRITGSTGLTVDLRVLRPAGGTRRLPLVVLLGGHRTGRDAVDVVGDPGAIVVAALDYPYRGPERPHGLLESVGSVPAIQRGLRDTPPAVSLALDWLIARPWVDAARVELMGVSLGVPFAAVAGALDDRFRRVWLIHGGVGNRAWIANRLEGRITNKPLRDMAAGLVHLLAYGSSFKTEEWAPRIAPRAVIVVGAREDEQMPRENVEQLYAAARAPKEILWSDGGHVGPNRADIVRQLLAMVRSRIDDPGK